MFRNQSIIYQLKLIITCEHGGNAIPEPYRAIFKTETHVLETHLGYDLGALDAFDYLKPLSVYSKASKTSRLFIELNRSLHHPKLFSKYTKPLQPDEKESIISIYYHPFRNEIEAEISKIISTNEGVLHLSIHSFTPNFNGDERRCDIGLLFDSRRLSEKECSKVLKSQLQRIDPNLNVRFNYPYLGKADGFTTYLRRKFTENYIGIEIEINQKFSKNNRLSSDLKQTLYSAIQGCL